MYKLRLLALLFLIAFFESCSSASREKELSALLSREIKNKCICFDSAKISVSPNLENLISNPLDEYLEEQAFSMQITSLTPAEKTDLLRLGQAVFDTTNALYNCLANAEEDITIYNSEDAMWSGIRSQSLQNKNTCSFYKYLIYGSLKYAWFAMEYSKLTDLACNCFSSAKITLDTSNLNIINVLDEAAGFLQPLIETESFHQLSKEDQSALNSFSELVNDTTTGLGHCLNEFNKQSRQLDEIAAVPKSGPNSRYAGIKWAMKKKLPGCRLMYYYFYSLTQPSLEQLKSKQKNTNQ